MRKPELPALTGIRFFAALIVFFSHLTLIPGMDTFNGNSLWFDAGVVGVSFFFVLSGFILSYNYSDFFNGGVTPPDYRRFVWERMTKIFPVHLAMLAVMIPIQIYSPHKPLDWRAVPFHFFLLQCFWPITNPTFYNYLNVPSWSISCEWFFYLLAPTAFYLAAGKLRRWVLIGALVIYILALGIFLSDGQSDYTRIYLISWFGPSRFIEFVIGVFLARLYVARGQFQQSARTATFLQIAGLVLLVAGANYRQYSPWPLHGGLLYVPGGVLLIYGLALGRGFLANHLKVAPFTQLGTASFSFYLIHAPIFRITKGIFLKIGYEVHSLVQFWLVAIVMFVVAQTAALIVYREFEMPMQFWLRRRRASLGRLSVAPSTSS